MKPIVMIDADGVIVDLMGHIVKKTKFPLDQMTKYHCEELMDENQIATFFETMTKKGMVSKLKPYDGFIQLLLWLKKNAEIIVATAPYPASSTWMEERKEWLIRHGFDADEIVFCSSNMKAHLIADVMIEDRLDTLQKWSKHMLEHGRKPLGILIRQPWNENLGEDDPQIVMVDDLEKAVELLQETYGNK